MKKQWVSHAVLLLGMLVLSNSHAQSVNAVAAGNPNTAAMIAHFEDEVCSSSSSSSSSQAGTAPQRARIQAATKQGQTALRNACGVYLQSAVAAQRTFIEGLDPAGFISFKLDGLLFARNENDSSMERMQALRRSHSSVGTAYRYSTDSSLSASVPAAIGGGASADDSSQLLGKKLGLWFRVNSSSGEKDPTLLTGKLDSSQYAGAVGLDYRLNGNSVLGGSIGYRNASAKFGDGGAAGKMDNKTIDLSAYFSAYVYKDMYIDTVVNYGKISFDTQRNVSDLSPPIVYSPTGSTDGNTLSFGAAVGYEFATNGWTITPSLNYLYIDSKIDAFEEDGTGPFDLAFGKQHYNSSSAKLDLNVSYAISSESAVWLPHLRVAAIKEFGANIDTFNVTFVNELNPAPVPLPIQMDKLDDQYFRISLGLSAQFHNDVSAYIDYQQLVGFEAVTFSNIVAGMRFQF